MVALVAQLSSPSFSIAPVVKGGFERLLALHLPQDWDCALRGQGCRGPDCPPQEAPTCWERELAGLREGPFPSEPCPPLRW